jgi:RNA polymerase sigma-70 factor (ECF subfamily)
MTPNQGETVAEAGADHALAVSDLPTTRAADDRELVWRVTAGDADALAWLYDRYASTVCALALRITGRRAEAEEITQEVFWQVWKHTTRFDPARASFSAWVLIMTRNRALDGVRARTSGGDAAKRAAREHDADSSPGVTPERELALEERARAVRKALAQLPATQREALELAYYRGLTHAEIAQATGDPLGTVKSRIAQGIRKLRALLDDFVP